MFWTESAFHYRYARMYAAGQPLPDPDTEIQHPEGIHPLLDETPVMERFAGWAYRHFGSHMKFHVFLMGLACLYSGLTLFPAWLLARVVWRRRAAATAAVLFYATSFSYIGVVPLGDYVRQDFALPFLFSATALWLASLRSGRTVWTLGAALFLVVGLMSWHLTRFYLLVLLAVLWLAFLLRRNSDQRRTLSLTALVVAAVTGVAGIAFARLRYTGWLASPCFLLLAALGLCALLPARPGSKRQTLLPLLLLLVALATAWFLNQGTAERYSHVYQLLAAKLKHLGKLPQDLRVLPFEARAMWSSSFTSPGGEEALIFMGTAWLAGAVGALFLLMRKPRSMEGIITAILTAIFIPAFLLVRRMDVFLAFFLSVAAGGLLAVPGSWRLLRWSRIQILAAVAFAACIGVNAMRLTRYYIVSGKPLPQNVAPLYQTIRSLTRRGEPVLAQFQLSPAICLYCDRPVVIHSKFENAAVRRKVEEFYTAFFRGEEALYRLCGKYGVAWVVYEPNMMLSLEPGSLRFMAAAQQVPVDSAACLMHFFPARLKHFVLVYQDERYRLFKVVESPASEPRRRFAMLPVYDARRFNPMDLGVTAAPRH